MPSIYSKLMRMVVVPAAIIITSLLFFNVLLRDVLTITISLDYKIIFFNVLASMAIIFCLLALPDSFTIDNAGIILLFFTAYVAVNYFFKADTFFSNSLYALILTTFLAVLIRQIILVYDHIPIKTILAASLLTAGALEIGSGLLQLFFIMPRTGQYITGTFYNSSIFAIYTAAILMFSVAYYLYTEKQSGMSAIVKFLCVVNIFLGALALPATHSRASWISVLVVTALLLFFKYRNHLSRFSKYKNYAITIMMIIAGIVCFALYHYKKDSADGRIVIWKTGLIAIQDNFLTGLGFNQIQNRFGDYQAVYFDGSPEEIKFSDKIDYAFNDFLHIFVENGLIGFVLFIAFLWVLYRKVPWKRLDDPYLAAAVSGSLCILISSLFSYPFEMISIRFLFFFFIGLIMTFITVEGDFMPARKLPYIPLLCVFFCLYVVWQQRKVYLAKKEVMMAQNSVSDGNFENAVLKYRLALGYIPGQKNILPAYGMSLLMLEEYQKSIKILTEADRYLSDPFLSCNLGLAYSAVNRYDDAEAAFKKAIRLMPNRMYSKYLLAGMYNESGNRSKAQKTAEEILTMPVKIESTATLEMRSKMRNLLNHKN